MKLLVLVASLSLSLGAAVPNSATAEEKKAAADVERALDLGDVVQVTVTQQTYTVRTSVGNAEAVLDAIEGLDDDALNGCCSVPKPS